MGKLLSSKLNFRVSNKVVAEFLADCACATPSANSILAKDTPKFPTPAPNAANPAPTCSAPVRAISSGNLAAPALPDGNTFLLGISAIIILLKN